MRAFPISEQVEATVAPFGGKWLAQGPVDVIEGAWPGSVVLMEFPSRHAATAWYNSAEYQAIAPLRIRNAISDLVLIDALPDGFTIKGFAEGIRQHGSNAPEMSGCDERDPQTMALPVCSFARAAWPCLHSPH